MEKVYGPVKVSADSARTAAEAALLEQRPWIGAPNIIVTSERDDAVTFTMIFKNVGHTPTRGLFIDAKFVPWNDLIYSESANQCETGKRQDVKLFKRHASVPGSDFLLRNTPSDRNFINIPISNLKKIDRPGIAGCIVYGSPFDEVRHQTQFVALISINGNNVSVDYIYAVEPN